MECSRGALLFIPGKPEKSLWDYVISCFAPQSSCTSGSGTNTHIHVGTVYCVIISEDYTAQLSSACGGGKTSLGLPMFTL